MQYANAKEKDWCRKGHEDDRVARYILKQTFEKPSWVEAVVDVDDNEYFREVDVDLVLYKVCDTFPEPGELVRWLEIKADDFPLVYNKARGKKEKFVFIETLSNSTKGTPGWIYTTQADHIVYFFMQFNRYIIIKTEDLRRIANSGGYAVKRANTFAKDNKTILYHSEGVLIPVSDLLPFCHTQNYIRPALTVQEAREILKIA